MLKNKIGIHIQQTGRQDQELGCNASENLPGPWNYHVSVYKSAKQQHSHFNHSCEQTRVFLLDRIDGVFFLNKPSWLTIWFFASWHSAVPLTFINISKECGTSIFVYLEDSYSSYYKLPTKLHGIITQNNRKLIFTSVTTSNLIIITITGIHTVNVDNPWLLNADHWWQFCWCYIQDLRLTFS